MQTVSTEVFCFEEGRIEVIKELEKCQSKPIITSFFGIPDSGKTHLINLIGKYFETKGLRTRVRNNGWDDYQLWAPFTATRKEEMLKEISSFDILMYHCPWDARGDPWRDRIDPEELMRNFFGRKLDLAIGIFNPRRSQLPRGNYDIIISNRASYEKPVYLDD